MSFLTWDYDNDIALDIHTRHTKLDLKSQWSLTAYFCLMADGLIIERPFLKVCDTGQQSITTASCGCYEMR